MELIPSRKKILEIEKDPKPKVLDDYEGILFVRGSCGNKPC